MIYVVGEFDTIIEVNDNLCGCGSCFHTRKEAVFSIIKRAEASVSMWEEGLAKAKTRLTTVQEKYGKDAEGVR